MTSRDGFLEFAGFEFFGANGGQPHVFLCGFGLFAGELFSFVLPIFVCFAGFLGENRIFACFYGMMSDNLFRRD